MKLVEKVKPCDNKAATSGCCVSKGKVAPGKSSRSRGSDDLNLQLLLSTMLAQILNTYIWRIKMGQYNVGLVKFPVQVLQHVKWVKQFDLGCFGWFSTHWPTLIKNAEDFLSLQRKPLTENSSLYTVSKHGTAALLIARLESTVKTLRLEKENQAAGSWSCWYITFIQPLPFHRQLDYFLLVYLRNRFRLTLGVKPGMNRSVSLHRTTPSLSDVFKNSSGSAMFFLGELSTPDEINHVTVCSSGFIAPQIDHCLSPHC